MDNQSLYNTPVTLMDGSISTLKPYEGQVLLIVNVASRCGFTPQYAQLEEVHRDFHNKGFSVLGFPCDQFMHQEPGSNEEIKAFAESCYRVTFPMFAKTMVKGKEQSPLYAYLQKNVLKKPLKFVPWNFSKFLVDQKGQILRQYTPIASFAKIRQAVETLLV